MDLMRDVLDKQLVDRREQNMGKVDGLVIVIEDGGQPRVSHIECGLSVLAPRLLGKLGQRLARLLARWKLARRGPMRIPWTKVRKLDVNIQLEVDANRTAATSWEKWLRKNIVARIPGSG